MNTECKEFNEIIEIEQQIELFQNDLQRIKDEYYLKFQKAEQRKKLLFSETSGIAKGSKVMLAGAFEGTHLVVDIRYVVYCVLGLEVGLTISEIGKKGQPVGKEKECVIFSDPNREHYAKVYILEILEGKK